MNLVRLPTLFEDGCHTCPAGDVCPGDPSSPCGCVKTGPDRFACHECHLICRARRGDPTGTYDEDFSRRLAEGSWFDDVTLDHTGVDLPLPPLILCRVRSLPESLAGRLSAVGFDLKDLLTKADQEGNVTEAGLTTGLSLRERVRAGPEAELVAVLNGDDDRLEGFWGMDRTAFLMSLRGQGFRLVTGPTFSVYDDEPASHRTVMMMRHLQIVREAHALGLIVAPTLYWRGDYDIATWAEWLNANPSVRYVSRDFSRTKQDGPFEEQFAPFLSLLQRVGRPLHALVQGVGAARAANVLARLGGVGCTGSVVTASPIVMGNRGSALVLQLGRLKEVRDSETPHPLLAERNVLALMAHLVGEREAEAVWAARA